MKEGGRAPGTTGINELHDLAGWLREHSLYEGDQILMTNYTKLLKLAHLGLTTSQLNSIWPFTFGLACCAFEMMAAAASRFDIDRFGSGVFRGSPRQCDLMIVSGTVTYKISECVSRLWDQMPEPKWCIAYGACATNGGPYHQFGYHVLQGADIIIPVHIYAPGCPPRPETLLEAIIKLQDLIRTGRDRDIRAAWERERTERLTQKAGL